MRSKILCLVNSAPYNRPYFNQLSPYLAERGYDVVYALDSHLSDVLYADGEAIPGAWYFSDFALKSSTQIPDADCGSKTWSSLLSDFDRFLTMDIRPPLGPGAPIQYRDVPGLLARFFAKIFEVEAPIAVLYEQVSNSFAIAAFAQSVSAKVPFCSICPSRLSGRIEISLTGAVEDHRTVGAIYSSEDESAISAESYRVASEYIRNIDTQTPDYMKGNAAGKALAQLSLRKKYLTSSKIQHFLRGLKYSATRRKDCSVAFQHGDPVRLSFAFWRRAFRRRMRVHRVARFYEITVGSSPFVLYPLQSHPEASTSVLAPDFIDELNVIRSIAFRLPVGMVLCVKEHPSAIAAQPTHFYRQLSEMPNVRLLAAHLPAKRLIRDSVGVVCVTSTLGFEAAVLNKPVIALGDVLYGYFPNVRMIRNFIEIAQAFRWMMQYSPVAPEHLLRATAAYVEFGDPGTFDFYESLGDRKALNCVADALTRRLRDRGPYIEHRLPE